MRALIGVPGPKLTAPYPLGPDELRRFVQAVMEGDPVHWDEEAAAASRYGEVVATPLYPMHSTTRRAPGTPDPLDRVHDDPGWDGTRSRGRPRRPARRSTSRSSGSSTAGPRRSSSGSPKLGDVVSAQSRYTDITEREGRSGPMVLVKVETTYTNQDDETLVVSTMTVIIR